MDHVETERDARTNAPSSGASKLYLRQGRALTSQLHFPDPPFPQCTLLLPERAQIVQAVPYSKLTKSAHDWIAARTALFFGETSVLEP
jgi:hypothetical protein